MGIKMICVIAGNFLEAKQWAEGQLLEPEEWFFPVDTDDLRRRCNFHVVVVGTAGQNVPAAYFERVLSTAKDRGRIGRDREKLG